MERNYPTHNLEFAVVVFALKIWKPSSRIKGKMSFLPKAQLFERKNQEFMTSANGGSYFKERNCTPDFEF